MEILLLGDGDTVDAKLKGSSRIARLCIRTKDQFQKTIPKAIDTIASEILKNDGREYLLSVKILNPNGYPVVFGTRFDIPAAEVRHRSSFHATALLLLLSSVFSLLAPQGNEDDSDCVRRTRTRRKDDDGEGGSKVPVQ